MALIVIMVTASPFQSARWRTAVSLAAAAIERGHRAALFLFMDGVYGALRRRRGSDSAALPSGRLASLVRSGVRVCLCGTAAELRGLDSAAFVEGITVGGLPDLALMIEEADRLVSL
jgi:sulfur relay (sulfurtransferase) complex TusBCD TusD component (DsrE family)